MTIELLTLSDEVDFEGYWWLPEAPEIRIGGTLALRRQKRAALRLFGRLGGASDEPFQVRTWSVLFGRTMEGDCITLFDISQRHSTQNWCGLVTSIVEPHLLFLGDHHLESGNDLKFSKMCVNYTWLEEWFDRHPFESSIFNHYTKAADKVIRFHPSSPREWAVPSLASTVSTDQFFAERHEQYRSVELSVTDFIRIRPSDAQSWDWFMDVVYGISELLTLFFWQPIHPRAVWVWDSKGSTQGANRNEAQDARFQVYWHQNEGKSDAKAHQNEILFPFRTVAQDFGTTLDRWFHNRRGLRPVHNLLFGSFFRSMSLDSDFLSMARALEVFHKTGLCSVLHSFRENERQSSFSLETAMSENTNRKRTEKSKEGTCRPLKRITLRDRLRDLIDRLDQPTRELLAQDTESFIGSIVTTRNYLTHGVANEGDSPLKWPELYYAFQKLRMITGILLLRKVGIAEDAIVKAFKRGSSTRHTLDAVRRI